MRDIIVGLYDLKKESCNGTEQAARFYDTAMEAQVEEVEKNMFVLYPLEGRRLFSLIFQSNFPKTVGSDNLSKPHKKTIHEEMRAV